MPKRTVETIEQALPGLREKARAAAAAGDDAKTRAAKKNVRRAQRRRRTLVALGSARAGKTPAASDG